MRVECYRNLHRGCFSVRANGRVVAHVTAMTLRNVCFKVSEAGRKRVLASKRKNVHAFAVGELEGTPPIREIGREITYNPYRGPSFYYADTGAPCYFAPLVRLVGTKIYELLAVPAAPDATT